MYTQLPLWCTQVYTNWPGFRLLCTHPWCGTTQSDTIEG
nr:MAG TPA: Pre-rRNA-processing protein TSR2 [Caudoviricetes sp.]